MTPKMTLQEAINRIDLLIGTEKLFIKISTMGEISHSQNIEALEMAKKALDMINNEFKRNAEPLTQEYEENVDVALVHLNRDFKKILGEKYTKFIDE